MLRMYRCRGTATRETGPVISAGAPRDNGLEGEGRGTIFSREVYIRLNEGATF